MMPATATGNADEPSQALGTYTVSNTPNPAVVYTLSGADSGVISIDSETGVVTADSATVAATKSSYIFTVTATNSAGADSTDVTFTINAISMQLRTLLRSPMISRQ